MRQAALLGLVLAVVFGRDALNALQAYGGAGSASSAPLNVDRGLSAGFKVMGTFVQVKQLLQQQFPGIEVLGSTYPLSAGRQALSQAIGGAQMAGFGGVFFGDKLFEAIGVAPPPDWYARVQQSKPLWALGVWMVGNMAQSSASSTGAFEIYFDGKLVFSKLAAGRLPTQAEWGALAQNMSAALAASPRAAELQDQAELDRAAAQARAALAA
ncbi:SelT-like protein Flags: Precursor [Monoraphidium neglectum]|uniref:Selenoprotein T n=1 Tax=Monoraphidium neglectum TaxID=145388 RepID=A0A0D2JI44_9CHLO|nr:SelT-like protein Flags: Precursor [Monoraphidium neglectum]KIY99027.1 SelT-like protein Flags: Precursor [Monoraphidium neglectum]|eukprot:XP_013898047.1 SelT-like protein Flags: Precursor [Monoraphidium neglectum]